MEEAEHYDLAVQLAEEARDRLGRGDSQGALACAAVAQVHATLALGAPHRPDYEQAPPQLPNPGRLVLTDENGKSYEVSRESILKATNDMQDPRYTGTLEDEEPLT